jgi:hypothetical protein
MPFGNEIPLIIQYPELAPIIALLIIFGVGIYGYVRS